MLAAIVTSVLFSISAICGHRSSRLIGGTEANFWRITFATVILAVWSFAFEKGLEGSGLPLFLLSGVMGIGLGDVAYFQTLPRLGPRLSLLLVHCLPAPIGAILEWLWLGTTLTPAQILFGLVTLAGVAIALRPGRHLKVTRRDLTIGSAFGILAATGGAMGAVLSRKAYEVVHANGESISGINAGFQRVLGGLFIAGILLLIVKRRELGLRFALDRQLAGEAAARKWRGVWPWILMNSLAGQTLGVSFMQKALETTPAGIVLPIIATSPIVVIPLAYVFEGERPSALSLIGGVVAVAGVIGLTQVR